MGFRVGDTVRVIDDPKTIGVIDYFNDKKMTYVLRGMSGEILRRFYPLSMANKLFKHE